MKTFEYCHGKITPGLTMSNDDKFGKVLLLGIDDAGSVCRKVGLNKSNPAKVVGGRVIKAEPKKIVVKKTKHEFVVLEQPCRHKTNNILLRICTSTASEIPTSGSWEPMDNKPEPVIIVEATGFRKNTGIRFVDDLIVLKPGEGVDINPEGSEEIHSITNVDGQPELKVQEAVDVGAGS